MKHCESQEANRKPAKRKRPYTHHNCVTLDQGIAVRFTYARRCFFQSGAWWSTRDRTLVRDLAVRTDASSRCMAGTLYLEVSHTLGWPKKSMKKISRGWPTFTATQHGNQIGSSKLLSCLSIFGDHCSRREPLHSYKQTLLQSY